MLDLQIPIWALNVCGGWLLGVASIIALAAWLNWRQRNQMIDELGRLVVSFGEPEETASDDVRLN